MVHEHIHEISHTYNKKIALFADLHFSSSYSKRIFDEILNNIKKNNPDYICIPGDIIDDATVLKNEILVEELNDFLKKLSVQAPLILSYGNHDEVIIKHHKSIYYDTTSFFHNLNEIPNVYFLDNQNITIEGLNFIGYHPNYSYFKSKEKEQLENIDEIKKCIISNYCNILLCHSPIKILNHSLSVDYILAGHMHNGLVPSFFYRADKNRGLVGPYCTLFPKLSRGLVINEKTKLIITGGVKKISNSSSFILRGLNRFYPIDIDYIML